MGHVHTGHVERIFGSAGSSGVRRYAACRIFYDYSESVWTIPPLQDKTHPRVARSDGGVGLEPDWPAIRVC